MYGCGKKINQLTFINIFKKVFDYQIFAITSLKKTTKIQKKINLKNEGTN